MSLSISDIEREINKAKLTIKQLKKKYEESSNRKYLNSINTISEDIRNKNKELYLLKNNKNKKNTYTNISTINETISFTEIEKELDKKILELDSESNIGNTEKIEILKLKTTIKPIVVTHKTEITEVKSINNNYTNNYSINLSDNDYKRLNKLYESLRLF